MKFLFISKPFRLEPLGIMYLASAIKEEGHEVDLALTSEDLEKRVQESKPDFVGYSIITGDQNFYEEINKKLKGKNNFFSIAGGPHPTFFPEMLGKSSFDTICIGEGEEAISEFLRKPYSKEIQNFWFKDEEGIIKNQVMPLIKNLDDIPFPNREIVFKYPEIKNGPIKHFIASRGCPYNCLVGDTVVHTIEGDKKIKDLVGENKIGVFTMNPKTGEVFITNAINCRKTRENADILRVTFDDGTHIECTPEHKFLVFKNGNQFIKTKRWEVEAKDLKPKMRVHALKFYKTPQGYMEVSWGRRKRNKLHRMIYEYAHKIKLSKDDLIHHKDKNKLNNKIKNLEKVNVKEHIKKLHLEISERMRENNPSKNLPRSFFVKLGKMNKGRKRTIKTKLIQSNNQLGKKNSNYRRDLKNKEISELYRQGYSMKKIADKFKTNSATIFHRLHKDNIINHKIVSVIPIGKADVYDLEVPATSWFFANNVLVHNCSYCFNQSYAEIYKGKGKRVRFRSVNNLLDEIEQVIKQSPTKLIYLQDDTFILNKEWVKEFSEKYKQRINLPFHCHTRANLVAEEIVNDLKNANCYSVHIAAESGNEKIRGDILNRNMTNEQIYNAVNLLKKYGIKVMLQNMLGLPFTSLKNDFETLELNIKCQPDYAWVSIFQPYPRTELGMRCLREGVYTGDFSDLNSDFFDKSMLNIKNKNEISNLQKLFAIAVKYPEIYYSGGLQKLIELPYEETKERFTKIYKSFRNRMDKSLYGFDLS